MNNRLSARCLVERSHFISAVRTAMQKQGYLELITPVLNRYTVPDVNLDLYQTDDKAGWLRYSPELALKEAWSAGAEEAALKKIFEVGPSFRREAHETGLHSREFLLLEWYNAETDARGLVEETSAWLSELMPGWPPAKEWPALDLADYFAEKHGLLYSKPEAWLDETTRRSGSRPQLFEEAFFYLFYEEIEQTFLKGQACPVWVHGYPAVISALAETKNGVCERYELFFEGIELLNLYGEETRPEKIRSWWQAENGKRQKLGRPQRGIDEDWIHAVSELATLNGAGAALGLDRLFMLHQGSRHLGGNSPYYMSLQP